MTHKISVLIVSESAEDKEQLTEIVQAGGYQAEGKQVDSEPALKKVLQQSHWDVVLYINNLRGLKAIAGLETVKELTPELPFILIVDEDNHETGITAMEAGAHDYVAKDNLQRLVPVIRREIKSILERKERNNLLDELIKQNQNQSDHLDYLCHEVRSSLTSITIVGKMLANNHLSRIEKQYVNGIIESGQSVLRLVNSVLKPSKAALRRRSPRIEPVNIQTFADKLKQIYFPVAKEKNISFHIENKVLHHTHLITDYIYLEQCVKNLISNAIKFTRKGEVSVEINSFEQPEAKNINVNAEEVIAFRVKDTGIGIAKDKQQAILERYTQAGEDIHNEFGGTGLGLSICKENLELMGGELKVDSKVGVGSIFTAYLPVHSNEAVESSSGKTPNGSNKSVERSFFTSPIKAESSRAEEGISTGNQTDSHYKNKVLLVDDSHMQSSALKELLMPYLSACKTAGTAQEAYSLLDNHSFDFVIVDLILPDATGHEVIDYINNHPSQNSNIIVYTGRNLSIEEESHLKDETYSLIYKSVDSYKEILDIMI